MSALANWQTRTMFSVAARNGRRLVEDSADERATDTVMARQPCDVFSQSNSFPMPLRLLRIGDPGVRLSHVKAPMKDSATYLGSGAEKSHRTGHPSSKSSSSP